MHIVLFSLIFSLTINSLLAKSANSYGDEQVVPEGGGADLSSNTAPEEEAAKVSQESASSTPKSVASGYRRRRNSYGDESVVPVGGGAQSYDAAVEHAAEAVQQSPMTQTDVTNSGYRFRRNNQYGDEQLAPVGEGAQSQQSSEAAEQAPETVHQEAQAVGSSSEPSGY